MSQVQRLDAAAAAQASGTRFPEFAGRRGAHAQAGSAPEGRAACIVIQLTKGNLNNNHIYLRKHLDFFPADAIGAANARDGTGTPLTLHFAGLPEPVDTDIVGDKKLFRCRGPWREFFAHHRLAEGDCVAIERLSAYEYRVVPAR